MVLLTALGFVAGLIVRPNIGALSPTPSTSSSSALAQTGRGPAGTAEGPRATASLTPAPATPSMPAAVAAAIAEAGARTGVAYSEHGCGSGESCFSGAAETDGQGAAYVTMADQGYSSARLCYVYLHQEGGQWKVDQMACGAAPGFAPAVDATLGVLAPRTCGRLRASPSSGAAVVRCLANGARVFVTGTPTYADGQLWWPVSAAGVSGFLAQDLLVDASTLVPPR